MLALLALAHFGSILHLAASDTLDVDGTAMSTRQNPSNLDVKKIGLDGASLQMTEDRSAPLTASWMRREPSTRTALKMALHTPSAGLADVANDMAVEISSAAETKTVLPNTNGELMDQSETKIPLTDQAEVLLPNGTAVLFGALRQAMMNSSNGSLIPSINNSVTVWVPRGRKGAPGPIGMIGRRGPPGPIGPSGPNNDHETINLTESQGPQGEEGPQGPQGNRGERGMEGLIGLPGPQGKLGNFSAASEEKFESYIARLDTAVSRALFVDRMEHLNVLRELDRLKGHFGKLRKNLEIDSFSLAKKDKVGRSRVAVFDTALVKGNKISSAINETWSIEKEVLRRESDLRDKILTITQQQQTYIK